MRRTLRIRAKWLQCALGIRKLTMYQGSYAPLYRLARIANLGTLITPHIVWLIRYVIVISRVANDFLMSSLALAYVRAS